MLLTEIYSRCSLLNMSNAKDFLPMADTFAKVALLRLYLTLFRLNTFLFSLFLLQ